MLSWLGRRWSSRKLLKQDLTCLSNASQGSFYLDFCCRESISCLLIKYSRLIIINYWQNRNLHNQTNAGKEKKGSSVLLSQKIHLFLKFIEIRWNFCYWCVTLFINSNIIKEQPGQSEKIKLNFYVNTAFRNERVFKD